MNFLWIFRGSTAPFLKNRKKDKKIKKSPIFGKKLLAKKGIFGELHLDQFNQVGNAVPPIMAEHLAHICLEFLTRGK